MRTERSAQEMVFEYYYDRNDMDLELAIEEIRADIADSQNMSDTNVAHC
jgi:hypothetical protein